MKKLFIRFFIHRGNEVPADSYHICTATARPEIQADCIGAEKNSIIAWMEKHPEGKVDFVWLY